MSAVTYFTKIFAIYSKYRIHRYFEYSFLCSASTYPKTGTHFLGRLCSPSTYPKTGTHFLGRWMGRWSISNFVRLSLLVLGFGLCFGSAAMATPEIEADIAATEISLKAHATSLNDAATASDHALIALLDEMKEIRAGSLERIRKLTELRTATHDALVQATPAEAEAEIDPVANQKLKSLQAELVGVDGLLVRANLNASQADQLGREVSTRRKAVYFSTIFKRSSTPLASKVRQQLFDLSVSIFTDAKHWLATQRQSLSSGDFALRVSVGLLSFLLLLLAASPLYAWWERLVLPKWIGADLPEPETTADKLTIALVRAVVRLLVFVVPAALVFGLLRITGVVGSGEAGFLVQILLTLGGVMLADGVALAFLSPRRPHLRLAALSNRRARNYRFFAIAALWVFAIDHMAGLSFAHKNISVSLEAVQAQSAIVTLLAAGFVLLAGVQAPLATRGATIGGRDTSRFRLADPILLLSVLRLSAIGLALTGMVACLIGYVELGRALVWALLLIVLSVAGYILLRNAVKILLSQIWARVWAPSTADEKDEQEPGGVILSIWLRLLADIALAGAALWVFLQFADFRVSDIDLWASRISEGVPIGATTLRLTDIAAGVFSFVLILLLFRGLKAYLRRGMDGPSGLRDGANASVLALVGYLGFVVAIFVGFGATGVQLSNIALIVSALSVGIGFGLQGVVNNFVSGLILLFERPVNIGDWVVTTAGEGYVRRIGLRSTEIVTFNRASIMVPNSDLITSPLTNWTHKDKTGRVIIPVGVAYGSDPEQVREVLLACAIEHPLALRRPEPYVYWKDFGSSSLDFELRVFIRNITNALSVETDLRFAIFAAFKANGIEIPFPQQEVHLVPAVPPSPPKPVAAAKSKPKM